MKKSWLKCGLSMLMAFTLLLGTAACSKQSNTASGTASGSTADPLGKYSPAITLTSVQCIDSTVTFENGDTYDNNVWTRLMEDQLGIKIKYLWEVPGAQYADKLTLSIASNDLPDIIPISKATDLKQLVDNGVLQDLTSAEKCATKQLKDILTSDNNVTRNSAVYNGKLYAMDVPALNADSLPMMWLRTDWLTKLGISEPKTMSDVLNIMDAFVTKDPDGNGKNDTIGMLTDKNMDWLSGFYAGYHAYPFNWITGSDGKVTYGSLTSETKQALTELQELYKKGCIDAEFSVKDSTAAQKSLDTGKCGLFFATAGIPSYMLKTLHTNDPKSEWKPYAIPSIDSKMANVLEPFNVGGYFAVKKGVAHPEALYKFANLYVQKYNGSAEEQTKYARSNTNMTIFKQTFLGQAIDYGDVNAKDGAKIREAVKNNSSSSLNVAQKSKYDQIVSYLNGDQTYWYRNEQFGSGGGFEVESSYLAEKGRVIYPAYTGAPTATMQTKLSTLQQMEAETFTKIIMGQSPISDFDKFVSNWKSLGGNDILKEISAANAANAAKK